MMMTGEIMRERLTNGLRRGVTVVGGGLATAALIIGGTAVSSSANAAHATGHVLLVGSYKGHAGGYSTIQAAVDAAQAGDWILVAPGVYHEKADLTDTPSESLYEQGAFGAVLITKPGIHLRGLNRNSVVVDGTKSSAAKCSSSAGDQQAGPTVGGRVAGRNGIVVFGADNVSIDNLTVCNFLDGAHGGGNQIWWNGHEGTSTIGIHGYEGSYLNTTTTYFGGDSHAGTYGIFSSDAANGVWSKVYASNMNDSGAYIGACQQACNAVIDSSWFEGSALGYSGTNSGGTIIIKNNRFNNNADGFDSNSQVAGDPPPPQNGACPNGGTSPITKTHSCWVVMNNIFENNNNVNAPRAGSASEGPPGTGMTIAGGTNDTVMNNIFRGNKAWGLLIVPFPDDGTPPTPTACANSGGVYAGGSLGCVYDPKNITVKNNTFSNNGTLKNPSNGDIGELTLNSHPTNCYIGNKTPDGVFPAGISKVTKCTGTTGGNAFGAGMNLYFHVLCDTGLGDCPAGAHYPVFTGVKLTPMPPASKLASMPNPCLGVPSNAWCKAGKLITK